MYLTKKITDRDLLDLRLQFKAVLLKILSKLLEKSPIKYSTVRHLSCLNPSLMINNKQGCIRKMKLLLANLCEINEIKSGDCDEIMADFSDFLSTTVIENSSEFLEFNQENCRLDILFVNFAKNKHKKLWSVLEKLLLLSHGQGTVERGFSINKKIEVENMKEHSYIAQRIICEYLNNLRGDVTITKEMRASVSNARQRYLSYLKEEKKKVCDAKQKRKRVLEEDDESEFKRKKRNLEKNIKELLKSADEYADQAENENNVLLISKSNSLRRTAKAKQKELLEMGKKFQHQE